jgi:hypothetical protein
MKAFILANISDVLSTLVGLAAGGIEVNPFIGLIMEATSVPEALLVKLAIASGIGLLINRWKPHLLNIPTMALAVIAISNSMVALGYA